MSNPYDPWGDDPQRFYKPEWMDWWGQIWHVGIKEDARHLWPNQWLINGYWEDEKRLYEKYQKVWEERRQAVWDRKQAEKKNAPPPTLEQLAEGLDLSTGGENCFSWNVVTPGWSMHRDGTWHQMLVGEDMGRGLSRDQYPGIYNSYEEACKTLASFHAKAPRYTDRYSGTYEQHLKNFVEVSYDYELDR